MADERLSFGYTDGATVSVEIIRQGDGDGYDWDDAAFKAAAWVERLHEFPEDVLRPGRFTEVVDPATWEDGKYEFLVYDAALTPPIALVVLEVAAGQFVSAPGVGRGVWVHDITAVNENLLLDQNGDGTGAIRAATAVMNVHQRWLGKVVADTAVHTLTIYAKDNVTILAVLPFESEGDVQTTGPAAAP